EERVLTRVSKDAGLDRASRFETPRERRAPHHEAHHLPNIISSTSRSCSLPKKISSPTKKVGEPNAPRSTAFWVVSSSRALTSGSCARASSFAPSRPDEVSAAIATSG